MSGKGQHAIHDSAGPYLHVSANPGCTILTAATVDVTNGLQHITFWTLCQEHLDHTWITKGTKSHEKHETGRGLEVPRRIGPEAKEEAQAEADAALKSGRLHRQSG